MRWQIVGRSNGGIDREISAISEISASGVSSELVFKPNENDNGATYRCEASNPATIKPLTASITLSVFYISQLVTIKLKPKYPKSGESLSLTCDSGACNPLCEINWYKNGQKIIGQNDGITEMNVPFGGKNTRNKLKLNVTSKDDRSEIICEAVNQPLGKSVKENLTLQVLCESK